MWCQSTRSCRPRRFWTSTTHSIMWTVIRSWPNGNAHYDERCLLPIHINDTVTGRLRPGKFFDGAFRTRSALGEGLGRDVGGDVRQAVPTRKVKAVTDGACGRSATITFRQLRGCTRPLVLLNGIVYAPKVSYILCYARRGGCGRNGRSYVAYNQPEERLAGPQVIYLSRGDSLEGRQ